MNSTGGRSVGKKALTSQVVGVEVEWGAGSANPTSHVLGCEGSAGSGLQLFLTLQRNSSSFLGANLNFLNPADYRCVKSTLKKLPRFVFHAKSIRF
jgi:hypothetical protein